MAGIFINYRGDDSQLAGALLYNTLSEHFGEDMVFLDSRSIGVGDDFVKVLGRRLPACSVLLAVIGPRWLTEVDHSGAPRIWATDDWVRRELTEALRLGLRVIPILLDNAKLPQDSELPDDIAEVSRRQYVHLRRRYAKEDVVQLIERLSNVDPDLAAAAGSRVSRQGSVPGLGGDFSPSPPPIGDVPKVDIGPAWVMAGPEGAEGVLRAHSAEDAAASGVLDDDLSQPPYPSSPYPPAGGVPPTPEERSKKLIIVLSVAGGLFALCCLAGVVAIAATGSDPSPEQSLADQLARPGATGTSAPSDTTAQEPAETEPPLPPGTITATEPPLPPGTITATGDLLLGSDITAGTYRGVGCGYWARLKNADGELDSILANGNVDSNEHLTVTILKSDFAFANSCEYLLPVASLRTVPKSNTSNEFGTLVVGKDIHPGTWRGTATGSCYWARTSGFTGNLNQILANNNVNAGSKFTINVKSTDKGLELSSDCGALTRAN